MCLVEGYAGRLRWYDDEDDKADALDRIKSCIIAYERCLLEESPAPAAEIPIGTTDAAATGSGTPSPEAALQAGAAWRTRQPQDRERLLSPPLVDLVDGDLADVGRYDLGYADLLLLLRAPFSLAAPTRANKRQYRAFRENLEVLSLDIDRLATFPGLLRNWSTRYGIGELSQALLALVLWPDVDADAVADLILRLELKAAGAIGPVLGGAWPPGDGAAHSARPPDQVGRVAPSKLRASGPRERLLGRPPGANHGAAGPNLRPTDEAWWEVTAADEARLDHTKFDGLWMSKSTTWEKVRDFNVDDLLVLAKHGDTLPTILDPPSGRGFAADLAARAEEVEEADSLAELAATWRRRFAVPGVREALTAAVFDQAWDKTARAMLVWAAKRFRDDASWPP